MKKAKLFLIPFFILLTNACSSVDQVMQKELDKVYINMPIEDFRKTITQASAVYLDEEYSCYKLNKRYAKFGDPNHYSYTTRFFYFKDNKLWRIDEGERATDYRIQIDRNDN